MTRPIVTRVSDGKTLDVTKEEAEHADVTARAKRVTQVDSSGVAISSTNPLQTSQLNSLITEPYDYIALTYVSSGNGAGEIETVTFKTGGSTGTAVGVLTLTYDANNKLDSVTKS